MARTPAQRIKAPLILACVVAGIAAGSFSAAQVQKQVAPNGSSVQAEMRNVMYHFTDEAAVHIVRLDGRLVPQKEGCLPIFDDPQSFTLAINSAEISMRTDSLTNVLNQYVFAASDSPIKNVAVTIPGTGLKVNGRLHSKATSRLKPKGGSERPKMGKSAYRRGRSRPSNYRSKGLWICWD